MPHPLRSYGLVGCTHPPAAGAEAVAAAGVAEPLVGCTQPVGAGVLATAGVAAPLVGCTHDAEAEAAATFGAAPVGVPCRRASSEGDGEASVGRPFEAW